MVIIISYHEDALGKEAGGRGWGLPRAFQLLEYQYGEGRFDKQTSSFPPLFVKFITEVTSMAEGSEKTKLLFWGLTNGKKWPKMAKKHVGI